ncbi:MAG TPA: hypothetical protein VK206_28220 [Anaerolineales bacterium]|nr:hypothetical protein [Anaerolineales bacterium]HLO32682.1 hypothetical protein [Anaerolineales bacterium]
MNAPTPQEEFEHTHKDFLVRLENLKLKLQTDQVPELAALDESLTNTLNNILERLAKPGQLSPQEIFKEALKLIPEVDAKRFLIENLLEDLKRGGNMPDIAQRYHTLGLLNQPEVSNAQPTNPVIKLGEKLINRKRSWGKVGAFLCQFAINALRVISKSVEIEPQLLIVGGIPSIGFTFKGSGLSFDDIIQTLTEDIQWS